MKCSNLIYENPEILNLSMCVESSTDIIKKNIYIYTFMCHLSLVTCHLSPVTCLMPCLAYCLLALLVKTVFLLKPLGGFTDVHVRIYFDVLTQTPARNLLERLRKKNWNFKTPFTHGLRHF